MNADNRKSSPYYETVAVTPLPPGWTNHYRQDDGTVESEACPAILLQEHRSTMTSWDVTGPDGTIRRECQERLAEPPFETVARFADHCTGVLYPADESVNYIRTTGPGEPFPEATAVVVPA